MTPNRDIVDAIDELVDWQMSNHANRSGYDYNVGQDKCPHSWCSDDFHGLPITSRMREMRGWGHMDPDYRYADDTTDVLCPGSEFVGEFTPPASPNTGYDNGDRLTGDVFAAYRAARRDVNAALLGIPNIDEQIDAMLAPSLAAPPSRATEERARRGVIDMTAVDSLRGLRCQVGAPNAAHAEYLREHVVYSFVEEVASRYPGVQLDLAEIRTEYRQEPHGNLLVAWWEPIPAGGILDGGHAHGRLIDEPTYGSAYRTVAPFRIHRPTGETAPMYPVIDTIDYERAGYDTVARRWVYKPRPPARPAPAVRTQPANRHLVAAPNRAEAWRYAATHGLNPVIVTHTADCRGLDPTRFVIHDLGCDPRLRAELRHRAGIAGVTLESLIHTPGDQAA
ncbi:hypothetical protein ACFO5K_04140 [Nocardia halotolerans]|uniref:RES domain-containing protein n=1 Tax=Nocardia halotolerans TaxID=1755878 RepID=A0ABV8VD73_9NOCA